MYNLKKLEVVGYIYIMYLQQETKSAYIAHLRTIGT